MTDTHIATPTPTHFVAVDGTQATQHSK